jgi:DNA-binding NarL/FixJ family response regulator
MIFVSLMDDHPLILKILRQELQHELDIRVLWDTSDSSQLLPRLKRQTPDVMVLDLAFTQQAFEPVSMVRDLRAQYPHMRVLILTAYDEPIWIDELLRAGAQGYVVKSDDFSLRLAEAIRTVAQGKTFLSPSAAAALTASQRKYTLTARERAILRLVAQGQSNPEIAAALDIADGTVRNHISNIYAKLGVDTREAALQAAQNLRELPKPDAHLRHELRTPLHTLLGLVHLLHSRLQRGGQLDAGSAELFEQITREAERLDGMIDDMTR